MASSSFGMVLTGTEKKKKIDGSNRMFIRVYVLLGMFSPNQVHSSDRSTGEPVLRASPIISPSKNSLYPPCSANAFIASNAAVLIQALLSPRPTKKINAHLRI